MKREDIILTEVYGELANHYRREVREKRAVEHRLDLAQARIRVLEAALEERRHAMVFFRFV